MTDQARPTLPRLVPYRRVLYGERLEFFETAAGNAWTMAMIVASAAFFLWFERYLALDRRVETAGSLVGVLIAVFLFGRHLRLQVTVDEEQIHVDFAGLRRRVIDVADVVSLRVVEAVAQHEWQDRNWRRRNGWSHWFSGLSGVVLELHGDEQLLVASEKPEELRDAILSAAEISKVGADAAGSVTATRAPLPQ